MRPQESLATELKGLEERLLVPDDRKSTRLVEFPADEFIEFGSSGRFDTRGDLEVTLKAEVPAAQTTSDFRVANLAPDVVLLAYRIRRHSQPAVDPLGCPVWGSTNGKWQMLIHQGAVTPIA